jgi:hypothetical protein
MAKKKKLIPFKWLPAAWGLSGKSFDRAEAEYYNDGYDLKKRIIEIDYTGKDLEIELLRLDNEEGLLDDYDFAMKSAELLLTGEELELRKLEIDHVADKITDNEYQKKVANIKKEPFICIIDSQYESAEGINGLTFEFDWNEHWIKELIEHGYSGVNEDHIIQQWFDDLCRSVISENNNQQPIPFNSGRIIDSVRNGRTTDFS